MENEGSSYREAMEATTAEYERLIAQFCTPTVQRQGVSYGSDSMHHPELEAIQSETICGTTAIVHTRHVRPDDFVSDYEYHLVRKQNAWRIASLLYVDEEGKYECL